MYGIWQCACRKFNRRDREICPRCGGLSPEIKVAFEKSESDLRNGNVHDLDEFREQQ